MLGIGSASAIAGDKQLAAIFQRARDGFGDRDYRGGELGRIARVIEDAARLIEMLAN
jgi:hypothetical protein